MNNLSISGNKILSFRQTSILSAASVITVMIVFAQLFGLIRQWTILKFFGEESFSLFMAAFRLPDLVFEVFAFGAFSSAFIPVFSKYLKKDENEAWDIASRVLNIGVLIFFVLSVGFGIFSEKFYSVVASGFDLQQTNDISNLARFIFLAQGFFVASYVITGVLESSRMFLVPALAPVFYNIGIILGTLIFSRTMGIFAPALGVVVGAFLHLIVQLPVAYKLGFRFSTKIEPNEGVKEIGRLAAPRLIDLTSLQIQKTGELFFSSLISTASYAYLNLGLSLQAIPIMLFGVSLGKATLVTLSHEEDVQKFTNILYTTLNQMMFLVIPIAIFMIILRIPIVRLTYGTSQSLDWNATVQIGLTLSYFAIGIPFQAGLALINRAFFAKKDTKTPVLMSLIDVAITLIAEYVFVLILNLPVWSIALANTVAVIFQVGILYVILIKKLKGEFIRPLFSSLRSLFYSLISALVMFVTLKLFDKSVWVKQLSFVNKVYLENLQFEKFVLDTRYTLNLAILTLLVFLLGLGIYVLLSYLTKSKELMAIIEVVFRSKKFLAESKKESVTEMEIEG